MHPRAGEIADDGPPVGVQAQDDDDTACLVFAQKTPGLSADDHQRDFVLISLHVNARAVAGISADIDLSAAHGIASGIPGAPVNDDRPGIHGVPDRILRVSVNRQRSAV